MLKAKQALRGQVDQNRENIRAEEAASQDQNGRPMSAMSRPGSRKSVGSWVTRQFGDTPSPAPMSAGRMRPMSAIDRGTNSRLTFSGTSKKKPYGSASWRSVSRMDYRPPSAGVQPPRLHLPKRNYSRPQSAFEPFELRTPGDPQAPQGCTSGFKLN